MLDFLAVMASLKKNMLIELPTGSGKSLILNVLAWWILKWLPYDKVFILVSEEFLAK